MNRHPRRLLVLFADTGGGHRGSAVAVVQALKGLYDDQIQIDLVNVLASYAPWPLDRLDRLYTYMVRLKGWPWAAGYHLSNGSRRVALLARASWPWVHPALLDLLCDHPADVILSCHPMLNHVTLRALTRTRTTTTLITLVTDLATAHAFWIDPEITCCLVPTKEGFQRVLAHGMTAERVLVTGLPVSPDFVAAAGEDPHAVRRRLGLKPGLSVVLVVGGGEGMGPMHRLCRTIAHSGAQAELVVIAGRNERLRAKLSAEKWPVPVRVEGFVHNMHEWMRAADLLVTKAGPSTISEALVMGLPIVLSGALPGQEWPNVDYVVGGGAGVWAPTPRRVAAAVAELLIPGNPRLARMASQARALARPDAAWRVARVVWAAACGELPRDSVPVH